MTEGELSFHVRRPPEVVFDFLVDLERAPEWADVLHRVERVTPGEVGVGTRYCGRVRLAGQVQDGELEIVRFERPGAFAYEARGGPARLTALFELEDDGGGTLVRHRYGLVLSGFAKMMEPMVRGMLAQRAQTAVDTLCAAIESTHRA
jgi:carbon monoxide dehydrogenase subunit G